MAKTLAALILGAALLAGCQQKTVENYPLPNLDGPVVSAPQSKAPVASVQTAVPAPLSKDRVFGVPNEWIPAAPANPWQWIVIHHSATPSGCAASFDQAHRQKGWDELGYHFVIGNGTGSPDGRVEVGPRWVHQKHGAHAKTPDNRFNDYGIGICLVGNFDLDRPTPAQIRSLTKLTAYLMQKYHIAADHVLGHCETKPTDCPGRNMSIAEVRRMATSLVAEYKQAKPTLAHTAGGERAESGLSR
ncbi:MAG: peptidoglycan recognition family protein [Bacillota bacterium]